MLASVKTVPSPARSTSYAVSTPASHKTICRGVGKSNGPSRRETFFLGAGIALTQVQHVKTNCIRNLMLQLRRGCVETAGLGSQI
jgi:hypothetical protein